MKPVRTLRVGYLARLPKSFKNSMNGLRYACVEENALQQELMLGLIAFGSLFFVDDSVEIYPLILTFTLMVVVELLNTAIEVLADKVCIEECQYIKTVKDVASSAVFLALLIFCVTYIKTLFVAGR